MVYDDGFWLRRISPRERDGATNKLRCLFLNQWRVTTASTSLNVSFWISGGFWNLLCSFSVIRRNMRARISNFPIFFGCENDLCSLMGRTNSGYDDFWTGLKQYFSKLKPGGLQVYVGLNKNIVFLWHLLGYFKCFQLFNNFYIESALKDN